jgi:hypothetical protein
MSPEETHVTEAESLVVTEPELMLEFVRRLRSR